MGDMADYALEQLADADEHQLDTLGYSNVYVFEPTRCSTCGGPLVERTGKFGRFLGCAAFPRCRGKTYTLGDREMSDAERYKLGVI